MTAHFVLLRVADLLEEAVKLIREHVTEEGSFSERYRSQGSLAAAGGRRVCLREEGGG